MIRRPEDTVTTGLKSYTTAQLNAMPRRAGSIARVTDGVGGAHDDTGTQWKKLSPWINPLDAPFNLSATGTAAANATAMTAALAAGSHLVIPPGTYATNSFSILSTKTVTFMRGAIFTVAAGQQITSAGEIEAGPWQIISSTDITEATAPLKFMRDVNWTRQPTAHVNWWGAVPDGANGSWTAITDQTDNSVALQQAFRACINMPTSQTKSSAAPRLLFGPGRYDFTTPLLVDIATQSIYGLFFEGAVGTKGDFTAPDTQAMMQTGLHYIGTGTGVTFGNATYFVLGGLIKNIWFSATTLATYAVRGYMTGSTFEDCLFTSSGDSGVEGGLRLRGYSNSINRCSFNNNWDGLWLDNDTGTTVKESIFIRNRGTYACILSDCLGVTIRGNTFQDNSGGAVGIDMAAGYGNGASNNTVIAENYFEGNSTYDNGVSLRGNGVGNYVMNTVFRENYFASLGSATTIYINLTNTSGTKCLNNVIPRNQTGPTRRGIVAQYGTGRNVNLSIISENNISAQAGNYTTGSDLNDCTQIFTNSGSVGATSLELPRGVPGLRMMIYKVNANNLTINRIGADTINGAASIANTTGAETNASIALVCWEDDGTTGKWIVESKTGTWA